MYTCVLLDEESVGRLVAEYVGGLYPGWVVKCHHMTVNMGPALLGPAANLMGKTVLLTVKTLASDGLVAAVGVECSVPSVNAVKHITLAVNEAAGGKPKMSNFLKDWKPVSEELVLRGVVAEQG